MLIKIAATRLMLSSYNRVKPHTAFRGEIESGIMKMIAIGLGKQKGAEACHQLGFKYMAENVPEMARTNERKSCLSSSDGLVENALTDVPMRSAACKRLKCGRNNC